MSLDKFGWISESHNHAVPNPSTSRLPFFYTADGAIDIKGKKIIHVDAPTNPTDVPNKSYVDGGAFSTACNKKIDSLHSQLQNINNRM